MTLAKGRRPVVYLIVGRNLDKSTAKVIAIVAGLGIVLCLPLTGNAGQQAIVCAKISRPEWSKASQVEATVTTGQELSRATGNRKLYPPISTYVVISNDRDGTTLIQMAAPQIGAMPTYGLDQQGRRWSISIQSPCL